jgi:hypothetical protein
LGAWVCTHTHTLAPTQIVRNTRCSSAAPPPCTPRGVAANAASRCVRACVRVCVRALLLTRRAPCSAVRPPRYRLVHGLMLAQGSTGCVRFDQGQKKVIWGDSDCRLSIIQGAGTTGRTGGVHVCVHGVVTMHHVLLEAEEGVPVGYQFDATTAGTMHNYRQHSQQRSKACS